jgi:hypothetical protein
MSSDTFFHIIQSFITEFIRLQQLPGYATTARPGESNLISRHHRIRMSTFIVSLTLFPSNIQHSTGLWNCLIMLVLFQHSRIMSYISTRQSLANATCAPTQQLHQVFLRMSNMTGTTIFGCLMGYLRTKCDKSRCAEQSCRHDPDTESLTLPCLSRNRLTSRHFENWQTFPAALLCPINSPVCST